MPISKTFKYISHSPADTIELGEKIAGCLNPGNIVCLFGDLGSGKTVLVKGIAKGLRIAQSRVKSPTFVLMNIYQGILELYHFDLYRLEDVQEIGVIGYEEFLYGEGVSVIEWADRMGELMPHEYLGVYLSHRGSNERIIKFCAIGKKYSQSVEKIKELVLNCNL